MNHRTLLAPAVLAAAALLSLGGIAAAQTPGGPVPAGWSLAQPAQATGVSTAADLGCVDETDPSSADNEVPDVNEAPEANDPAEAGAGGPDLDNLEEGDQTGPDEACDPGTGQASTADLATVALAAEAPGTSEAAAETESSTEAENDGPGGHEDTGAAADHQFEGEE